MDELVCASPTHSDLWFGNQSPNLNFINFNFIYKLSDNALLINRRKLRVENNNIQVNKSFKDIFTQYNNA